MQCSKTISIQPHILKESGEYRLNCLGCGVDVFFSTPRTEWVKKKERHEIVSYRCDDCRRIESASSRRSRLMVIERLKRTANQFGGY